MTSEIDDALIAAAAGGDPDARDTLLHLAQPAVRAACRRHLKRAREHLHSLDDASQNVLIELRSALTGLRSLNVPAFLAIIDVIARSVAASHANRAAKRDRELYPAGDDVADPLGALALDGPGPRSAADRDEQRRRAMLALSELRESDRDIIDAAFMRQQSSAEIAAALNITRNAAHMRLLRALAELRRRLGEGGAR